MMWHCRPLLALRLWRSHGRLVCGLIMPWNRGVSSAPAHEVVVVVSPTAPRLRRFAVYRRPAAGPGESLTA